MKRACLSQSTNTYEQNHVSSIRSLKINFVQVKTISKKFSVILAVLAVLFVLSSCEMTKPIAATSNPIGSKVGKSKETGILYFPPFIGNSHASIQEAAKNGGIKTISTVDSKFNWYILFWRNTTIVTGE